MEYILKTDSSIIYLDEYFYVFNKIRRNILCAIKNYKQVEFSSFDEFKNTSLYKKEEIYVVNNSHSSGIYFCSNVYIKVRDVLFELFENFKNVIKDFSVYTFEAIKNNEDSLSLNLIDCNNNLVEIINGEITNINEEYILRINIDDSLVVNLLNELNEDKMIHSSLCPHLIGFVVLDKNRKGINSFFKQISSSLNDKYSVNMNSLDVSASNQYAYLEDLNTQFIIEINYRFFNKNKVKIKNAVSKKIFEVEIDKIDEFITLEIENNYKFIYKNSLSRYLLFQNSEKTIYLCEECKNKHFNNGLIKPLSQNINKKICSICNLKNSNKYFKNK